MEKFAYIVILFQIFTLTGIVFTQRGGGGVRRQVQLCYAEDNTYGGCFPLSSCPSVANTYARYNQIGQGIQYLRAVQKSCGTRSINRDPIVCCKEGYRGNRRPPPTTIIPVTEEPVTLAPTRPRWTPTTIGPVVISTPPPWTTKPTQTLPPVTEPFRPREPDTRSENECNGPDAAPGVCKEIKQCPSLLQLVRYQPNNETVKEFLRYSNILCDRIGQQVCCPIEQRGKITYPDELTTESSKFVGTDEELFVNQLPDIIDNCGTPSTSFSKVVGGGDAKLGAWPWAALLGYTNDFDEVEWKCGGSLITQRHILTASHCVLKNLKVVRLGEHNLSTNTETKHIDVPVEKAERHPKYSFQDGYADIAIVYMKKSVPFTDFIKPVCLPRSPKLRIKSYIGSSPFVVGWGKTQEGGKSANILQQLQITLYENSVCSQSYSKQGRLISVRQFDKSVICAGFLQGGKDSCNGDSGGPLMMPELFDGTNYFYQIGVVSYGIGCARAEIPGIYTSVQHYMNWIEDKVRNTKR